MKYRCHRCGYTEGSSPVTRDHEAVITHHHGAEATPVKGQTKRSREHLLFPYDPYPQQLDFMKDAKDVLGTGGVLVAEACNGFGKTACALASVLPLGRRIVYATRTHEQVRQRALYLQGVEIRLKVEYIFVGIFSAKRLGIDRNEWWKVITDKEVLCDVLS